MKQNQTIIADSTDTMITHASYTVNALRTTQPFSLNPTAHPLCSSPRTELCRSEFCCTDPNPTPLYSGIFFYLQSCTKYITITQIIMDAPWGQRLFCATLMVASPPAHHRFFTRMNNSWHGVLTSTFPAPGWDGFFPTCFPEEKTKA